MLNNWFTLDKIDPDTYAISEYGHWEHTHAYLLIGCHSALLIDTGMGIYDMRPVVESLTGLPVTVIATHVHADHIGSHGSFERILVHPLEEAWLNGGFPLPPQAVRANMFTRPWDRPADFDESAYRVFQGTPWGLVGDGDAIDLGARVVRVIHTPGHSPGHMCFYEPDRGYLYSGDLVYKGTLFAFYPTTDPVLFAESVDKISLLPVAKLLPGHYELDVSPLLISQARQGFDSIRAQGKLFQGAGEFDFGDIKIRI